MFELLNEYGHEKVVYCRDEDTGLKAIIAIHSTVLGPAVGGCRMKVYDDSREALIDVLRLSRGMSLKTAAANLPAGGAKSVIIADSSKEKTPELLKAFARCVHSLGGQYYTAEDVGMSVDDLNVIRQVTPYAMGSEEKMGGLGDPSMATAYGAFLGIKAGSKVVFGSDNLKGKKVALQGVGNVGYCLAELFTKEGAEIVVTDINSERMEKAASEFGAKTVQPESIYDVDCDIFSPAALGGTINEHTIPRLKCKVIAGPANNQLLVADDANRCEKKGIYFVPDFIISCGGVILGVSELDHLTYDQAFKKIDIAYDNVLKIDEIAKSQKVTTNEAAHILSWDRIKAGKEKKER